MRVMLFVDARNILKENNKVDYQALVQYFSLSPMEFIRAYYYDGAPHYSKLSTARRKFFDHLRSLCFTLRLKEIDFSSKHISRKGVDIFLAADMISLAYENAYDLAILASGDGDYTALVDLVKSKGKRVWVLSFAQSLSTRLRQCADKVLFIDKNPEILRQPKHNV